MGMPCACARRERPRARAWACRGLPLARARVRACTSDGHARALHAYVSYARACCPAVASLEAEVAGEDALVAKALLVDEPPSPGVQIELPAEPVRRRALT